MNDATIIRMEKLIVLAQVVVNCSGNTLWSLNTV